MKLFGFNISRDRKVKESPTTAGALKMIYPSDNVWPDRNYENFSKYAYMRNVIAFRCVVERAKAVSSVPWKQFEKNADGTHEPTKEQPRFLERANPEESFNFFMMKLNNSFMFSGLIESRC
jgi:phage portal protein BeeE